MPPETPLPAVDDALVFQAALLVHESTVRAYVRRAFPALAESDDIVQEAFARVLRIGRNGGVSDPKAYLFATARNVAFDLLRRKRLAPTESLAEIESRFVVSEETSVPDQVALKLDLEVLNEAIQSLPERCRQVLTLRRIEGLSQKEIAARLGIAEHTVEAQVGFGVKRCRDFLRRRGVLPLDSARP